MAEEQQFTMNYSLDIHMEKCLLEIYKLFQTLAFHPQLLTEAGTIRLIVHYKSSTHLYTC